MGVDRRKFLKAAGFAALGLAGKPAVDVLAGTGRAVEEAGVAGAAEQRGEPLAAKRWAMIVDLRKCAEKGECTKCIDACHTAHNVPDFDNPKDEVKWIWKQPYHNAFIEQENEFIDEGLKHAPVILLCNHCDNPPCVRVCPTKATWKREEDGIVMMDWHRCVGCRFCVAACPYGSRSFNYRDPRPFIEEVRPDFPTRMRGVVEKCTFCDERLVRGRLPACVEACPNGSMVFGDLKNPESEVRRILHERFSIRRKPGLGTQPEVYYIV